MRIKALFDGLRKYDFSFFGISLSIFFVGILNLYSATHSSGYLGLANLYKTQLVYFLISIGVGLIVSFIHPKSFYRFSYFVYFLNIFLLILVLFLGHTGMGAKRWLVLGPLRFQPSELKKVTVILALARWFSKNNPELAWKLQVYGPRVLFSIIIIGIFVPNLSIIGMIMERLLPPIAYLFSGMWVN